MSIIGFIIGIIVVIILIIINRNKISSQQDKIEYKNKKIKPELKYAQKYNDIVEFIYSIREFYHYNNQTFSDFINLIDIFIRLYDDIIIGVKYCGHQIQVLNDKKYEILNTFHSLIYSLEDNEILLDKFEKSLEKIHLILNNYYNKTIQNCQYGEITNRTKFINKNELKTFSDYQNTNSFEFY